MKSPSVPSHQVVDDNFTAEFTGGIGFVIPFGPLKTLITPRSNTSSLLWCSCLNAFMIFASLISGILSYSSERYHVS
ncbi:hypothetical protein SS17_4717 [Escherichia coli O157:H7 str. SS17]|uniref:L0011 n=1 Tax=Escherichia coli TaxID=562 RepID=O85618_ECOLX|nr:L0011 [Escherichia coli O157:H7 str. EDL933]AIF96233.1 hypothetical protein SS17_4717 [Escherichia coli O157:H7 str. SS17]